jgi:AGCS family alanine or glycine:cation symporter
MKSKTLSFLAALAAMTTLSFAQEPTPAAEAAVPAVLEIAEEAAPAAEAEAPAAEAPVAAKPSALAAVAAEVESVPDTDVAATTEATSKWLEALDEKVNAIDGWVWGPTLIGAILVTGILLTCILRFAHLLNLRRAFRYTFVTESDGHGEVTSFGALCTALSATIGTGNIVGVATAIGTGGPGALFWMEVAAFFGMATKYAEGLLAVRYREIAPDGSVLGGPFYYIEKGLGKKWKWLAVLFAVFGTLAGIMGIGTITQIQGISSAADRFFKICVYDGAAAPTIHLFGADYSLVVAITGLVVTVAAALVLIGGLKRIASVSTVVVPFMAVFYVVVCLFLLLGNLSKITAALELIVRAAFNPQAFTGGVVGTIFIAMQKGIARGIFSNEAGLGSAPIAAAAAKTNEPVRQGLVCMTGTFIDTIVICTMTGLAIVVTGAWEPSLGLKGVDITMEAFRKGLGFLPHADLIGPLFLSVALAFFVFTTILGWDYYSEKCLEYLVGRKNKAALMAYRVLYVLVVFFGPYLTVSVVWDTADVFNGLMAFPNLVALVLLSPTVGRLTRDYFRRLKAGEIKE